MVLERPVHRSYVVLRTGPLSTTSIWRPVRWDFPWVSEHYELSDITSLPKKVWHSKRKFKFWQSQSSLSSLLSFVPMEFTTECKKYFHHYRTCSLSEISHLVATEIPQDQLPLAYLNSLSADNMTVCLRAIMVCWVMSKMTMVPREMQLCVVLADVYAKDALIAAGTGSGKTLPISLCILLNDPTANYLSITISPLKCLQVTQESDFNNRFGILTVTINEDTLCDNEWRNVSTKKYHSSIYSWVLCLGECL